MNETAEDRLRAGRIGRLAADLRDAMEYRKSMQYRGNGECIDWERIDARRVEFFGVESQAVILRAVGYSDEEAAAAAKAVEGGAS